MIGLSSGSSSNMRCDRFMGPELMVISDSFSYSYLILFIPISYSFGAIIMTNISVFSLGLGLILVLGWNKVITLSHEKRNKRLEMLMHSLFVVLILVFSVKTIHRNRVWQSRDSLFRSGLMDVPLNAKVHYNFGNLQRDVGNVELAQRHYRIALSLWPKHESSHNNLGTILKDQTEAEHHFMQVLRINPFHPRAHFNLANIYSKRGLQEEAISLLKRSIELDANFGEPYSALASIHSEIGHYEEARILHLKALEILPNNPDLINNYGAFLQTTGNTQGAVLQYLQALKEQPRHGIAFGNLIQIIGKKSK